MLTLPWLELLLLSDLAPLFPETPLLAEPLAPSPVDPVEPWSAVSPAEPLEPELEPESDPA